MPERGRGRFIQAVQIAPLGKQRGLRAVDVFRLTVAQNAAAEADHSAGAVPDGKHHTVEEQLSTDLAGLAHA